MNTRHALSIIAIFTVLTGANKVSAGISAPLCYDEDTDTIVYSFTGGAVALDELRTSAQTPYRAPPFYDEDTDTVVYSFIGDMARPFHVQASSPAANRITPYYDEQTDTVVYIHESGRSTQAVAMTGSPE